MSRSFSFLLLTVSITALALALAGAPTSAQPSIGNRNLITFPEQRVCIEDPKETNLRSKIQCYLIPYDDLVLKTITKNESYHRYQKDKYNIWSIVLQIIGVGWIGAKLFARISRYIP